MAYRASSLRSLGVTQIIVGALMVIFGIASMAAVHHWSSYIACGLWIGIWVLLTGLFGYLGSKSETSPSNCLIGLMIGFAVTSCFFTCVMFIIYCIALSQFFQRLRCGRYGNGFHINCYLYDQNYLSYGVAQAGAGLGFLLLALAIVEFFVGLASSIYGCNATCCGRPSSTGVVQSTQQVAYLNQGGTNVTVLNASHGTVLPAGMQTYTTYTGQQTYIQTAQPQMFPGNVQIHPNQFAGVQQQGYFAPPPAYSTVAPQQ